MRRTIGTLLPLFVFVAVLGTGARAGRADAPSTYVSDTFKRVAVRLASELVTGLVDKACPTDKPLCSVVVVHLADALGAVFAHDDAAIEAALKGLFLDGTIVGMVQATVADRFSGPELAFIQPAVPLILRCVTAAATNKPARDACKPTTTELKQFTSLVACKLGNTRPCVPATVLALAIANAPIDPIALLDALATDLVAPPFARPDIAMPLARISAFAKQGLDDGLFVATWKYVLSTNAAVDQQFRNVAGRLLLYPTPTNALMTSSGDAHVLSDIDACHASRDSFATWQHDRDQFFKLAKTRFFANQAVDLSPLDRLTTYSSCAGTSVTAFVRQVRFFAAPIRMEQALAQLAVPALSAAALIDYVRSPDESVLTHRTTQILAYAIAVVGTARLDHIAFDNNRLTPKTDANNQISSIDGYLSVGDGLQSCEVQMMLQKLGVTLPGPTGPAAGTCLSLVSGTEVDPKTLEVDVVEAVRKVIADDVTNTSAFVTTLPVDTLIRIVQQLTTGTPKSASMTLIRLGLDFTVAQVDDLALRVVGGDPKKCEADLEGRWIGSAPGAGCLAHVLISVSYKAVADYFWSNGPSDKSSADLAQNIYQKLLSSPAIGSLPIILNVGLGVNYIYGGSIWGDSGYGAATVVDKIGIAIYRDVGKSNRFEVGPFVGGFLDAIVRTAADGEKSKRFWLAGVTAGWTRLGGLDVGLEFHVGAAMPYSFGATDHYGFAVGAAVVVPFNFILEGK